MSVPSISMPTISSQIHTSIFVFYGGNPSFYNGNKVTTSSLCPDRYLVLPSAIFPFGWSLNPKFHPNPSVLISTLSMNVSRVPNSPGTRMSMYK